MRRPKAVEEGEEGRAAVVEVVDVPKARRAGEEGRAAAAGEAGRRVWVFVFVFVAATGLAMEEGEEERETAALFMGEAGRRCPSGVVLVRAIIMLVRLKAAGIVVRSGTGWVALALLTTLGAGLLHLLLPCCAVTALVRATAPAAAAAATGAREGLEEIRAGLDGRLEGRAGLEGRVPKARPPLGTLVAIVGGRAGLLLLLLLLLLLREARGRTGLPMPAAEVLMAGVLPAFVAAARGLEGVCVCACVDFRRRGDEGMVRCGVVACRCGCCGGSCAAAAGKSVDEVESTAPKSA